MMRGAWGNPLLAAAVSTALLAGCATAPAPVATPRPVSSLPDPQDGLEAGYRERALAAVKDRRWADALVQWEVLAMLRPGSSEYRTQIEQTQRRIVEVSAEAMRAGEAARKRGDVDQAQTQYLRVLAVDPDNAEAMNALREIDRERVRRAYFNRPPRNIAAPMARNGTPQTLPGAEIGVVLHRQGDHAGAIVALSRHLQSFPNDEGAKELLADSTYQVGTALAQQNKLEDALLNLERARTLGYRDTAALSAALRQTRKALADEYVRQGVQIAGTDRRKAISLWEQALKIDPTHADATARLRQARAPANGSGSTAAR